MHASVRQSRFLIMLFVVMLVLLPRSSSQTIPVKGTELDVDLYGNAYVLDGEQNTLRLFSKSGLLQREVGGPGWRAEQFDRPAGIWARNGIDVFVADYGNHRIQRFDRSLNYVSTLSTRDSDNPDERFGYPTDVALSRFGDLFICDSENGRIVKVDRLNRVERSFGGFGAGRGRLTSPTRVEIGPKDAVYVLDGGRVAVFDGFGNFLHDLTPGLFSSPTVLFADPETIAVVDTGVLYLFDSNERPAGAIPIMSLVPAGGSVRAAVLQDGVLRMLTESGVMAVADPRPGNPPEKP